MIRFFSASRAVLTLAAVLSVVGPLSATEKLPLVGDLEGDVERTPLPGLPPRVAVFVEGGGRATILGKFTFEFPHVVDPAAKTAIGTYTFVAANGDMLVADVVGKSTPIDGTDLLFIEEIATITGGTGRFAGATGNFTVQRLFDTGDLTTGGAMFGSIRLADGKR